MAALESVCMVMQTPGLPSACASALSIAVSSVWREDAWSLFLQAVTVLSVIKAEPVALQRLTSKYTSIAWTANLLPKVLY